MKSIWQKNLEYPPPVHHLHGMCPPPPWCQMRARISRARWIIIALFHQKPNELWNYLVGFLAKRCLRWCMTLPPWHFACLNIGQKKWVFVRCPKRAWIIAHGWVWPFGGQHGVTHYRGAARHSVLSGCLKKCIFIAPKNCSLSSGVISTS